MTEHQEEASRERPLRSVGPLCQGPSLCHGVDLAFLKDLKTKHKFSLAFHQQNQVAATAIKSLDSLNDQIVQYIFAQSFSAGHNAKTLPADLDLSSQSQGDGGTGQGALSPRESESLQASMVLMRRLLLDAQGKFRKMVEENKQLAIHIDGTIQAANQEVCALRAELADTNKRLSRMSVSSGDTGFKDGEGGASEGRRSGGSECQGSGCSSGKDRDVIVKTNGEEKADKVKGEVFCEAGTLLKVNGREHSEDQRAGNGVYEQECQENAASPDTSMSLLSANSEVDKVREENKKLRCEIEAVTAELNELRCAKDFGGERPSYGELKLELIQSRQEVNRAKEALQAMKSDRKRLKAEKVELLHQMKQLYTTLEDKETELRDFIRNYEHRVKESDESIKQLAMEKEESEREKWEIIKRARESAERAVLLRAQLDAREQTIKELQDEVAKLKDQLRGRVADSPRDSNNATPTPGELSAEDIDDISTATTGDTTRRRTAASTRQDRKSILKTPHAQKVESTPKASTLNANEDLDEMLSPLMKWMHNSSSEGTDLEARDIKNKKKKSFGSLSRVFSRGRSRRSIALPHNEHLLEDGSGTKLSLLTVDNYQEKLKTVDQMKGVHMCHWRAGQVLAWLEITLGMPMYGNNCAHNIKSGKILLGLSDYELGAALGITSHIHRRKLRLAIEEHRDPATIQYTLAPNVDPTWVAHRLMPDLGLPQYSAVFENNLVDGRILNSLGRKDLEKHFDIHRKFHQASILHGVELLRRMEFDKEKLNERRSQCEDSDTDLLVWTCGRVMKWTRSIDLGEFSDNLRESGVHGALMVLEPSFNSDTLATALAIPPSKCYIRRHLASELDTLLRPARSYQTGLKILRAALDTPNNNSKHLEPSAKSHTFTRSYRGQTADEGTKGRISFRGSLGGLSERKFGTT
ncbi:kazrin-like [Pomacea canaliculata]|uniref:kazrin-like n=1 Tax=Pomacea canaliculata TaxID=400727 RepID=UPI000D7316AA|nr:kazrin-like [Pomacea canaliculata]